jgi:hypothetical protein
MAGRGISTREVIDPTVNAIDVRTTRTQFTPQIARLATRDLQSTDGLRIVLQNIIDQQNDIAAQLSTLPLLGGVLIANQVVFAGVGNIVRHGLDGEVDVMATLPNDSALVSISDQDIDTKTVTLTSTVNTTCSILIFPKKRGA